MGSTLLRLEVDKKLALASEQRLWPPSVIGLSIQRFVSDAEQERMVFVKARVPLNTVIEEPRAELEEAPEGSGPP
jgi:hypothetical protein